MNCNVCGNRLHDPIYESASNFVLTSLCEQRRGRKRVWSCVSCGHLSSEELVDTEQYYASGYRILLDQDDEDQIYEVGNGEIIFRTQHQVDTLIAKLPLPTGAKLLDYGCAKASTPKQLSSNRKDLEISLFDVSDMYQQYWNKFVDSNHWSVNQTPTYWQNHFDFVTSFFALEHIPKPAETVHRISSLLNDDGIFYGIVPDTFGNVADFIVIDHVNHFTKLSLHALLQASGFIHVEIDDKAHRGALVFIASKRGSSTDAPEISVALAEAQSLANYWTRSAEQLRETESQYQIRPAAIYGSGFYGAYILSTLSDSSTISCFLDQSPFQQGKNMFGKPIVAPEQLPLDTEILYVGLNPSIARDTISKLDWLKNRNLTIIYLDVYSK